MNLAQTLYTQALEAAASIPLDATPFELETKRLAAFNGQGHNTMDYEIWNAWFNNERKELKSSADVRAQQLANLAKGKTPSEVAAELAAKTAIDQAAAPKTK